MDDLRDKIDVLLADLQERVLALDVGEMSDYGAGMGSVASSADEMIDRVRADISKLFDNEKEQGTNA